ncbi:hypothetical protein ACFVT6_32300 [Streptomyces sp. NPDC058049]|uniref:hypothetical protein n=1 Tax=Streptomyces sp. NPDC058049 TaxID=3346314 RepID=UPI0036E3B281
MGVHRAAPAIGEYGPYPKTLWQQFEGRRKLRLKTALSGRSRGGQISKVHLAADRRCRPLAFVLTAGQAADSP